MKVNPNIVCEQVGDEIVVLDSGSSSVVSITGHNATVVKRMLAGELVGEDEPGVSELRAQGILIDETSGGLSRRSLMMGGVAIGAGGVLALSLPSAAHASSVSLLPAPVFTPDGVNNYVGDSDWSTSDNPIVLKKNVRINQARFTNENDFVDFAPISLQWSFSPNDGFNQEFSLTGTNYIWTNPQVPDQPEVPPANIVGNRLKLFLRVRSGTLVSPSVEALFEDD